MIDKVRYKKWVSSRDEVLAVDTMKTPLADQARELVRLGYQATTDVERSPVTGEYYQWWERVSLKAD